MPTASSARPTIVIINPAARCRCVPVSRSFVRCPVDTSPILCEAQERRRRELIRSWLRLVHRTDAARNSVPEKKNRGLQERTAPVAIWRDDTTQCATMLSWIRFAAEMNEHRRPWESVFLRRSVADAAALTWAADRLLSFVRNPPDKAPTTIAWCLIVLSTNNSRNCAA